MTREEKVQWLVTNRKEWSGEEGVEILNAFSETRLDTLLESSQRSAACEVVTNAFMQGFSHNGHHYHYDPNQDQVVFNACDPEMVEEDDDEEYVIKKKKEAPVGNQDNTPMTLNEMYERGDSQVRGMIDTWKSADARERQDALATLTANVRGDEAKRVALATLGRHGTQELKALAQAMAPQDEGHNSPSPMARPSYYGAGGPPPVTNRGNGSQGSEDILPLPSDNYEGVVSNRLLERLGKNGK